MAALIERMFDTSPAPVRSSSLCTLPAMDLYSLLLFLHLSAVIVWVGGGVMFNLIAGRATKTNDPEAIARIAEESIVLGSRYYTPAALVTLGAGIGLVLEGNWGFGRLWILIGIAAIIISSVLGMAYFGKEAQALATEARTRGYDEGVEARQRRIKLIAKAEVAMLFLVVVAMVFKPEF